MKDKKYATSLAGDLRVPYQKEITDLSNDFRLPDNLDFSLFVWPKSEDGSLAATSDIQIIGVILESFQGEVGEFGEMPIPIGDWSTGAFSAIKAGAIDLTKYRVWWGRKYKVLVLKNI